MTTLPHGPWLIGTLLLLGAAVGLFIYRRLSTRTVLDRLITAFMPTLGVTLGLRLVLEITARPWKEWDPVRLTPVFALWHGYPLYPTSATGPALSYCYGPVSALAYLPVVVTSTPTAALLSAATMTVLFMLGPLLFLYLDRRIVGPQRIDGVLAFMAVAGIVFVTPGLKYSLLSPAHDAVALGLGAVATTVLCRRRTTDGASSLALSSVAAILAVWSKQTMVPLLVALPIYVLVVEGARTCFRYVLFLGTVGVLVSLLFVTAFDWNGLLLNMFEIPSRHLYNKSLHVALGAFQLQILFSGLPVTLMGAAVLYVRSRATGSGRHDQTPWGPWLAFVLVGVLQIPLALLAFAKVGGDVNAFSIPLYNLAIGTVLLLLGLHAPRSRAQAPVVAPSIGKLWLLALSLLTLVPSRGVAHELAATHANPSEAAFAFERRHPGRAYFPWNMLSVVMANGKVYDAEDGLISHTRMAGLPVSIEQFRARLPPHAKLLALPPNYPVRWTRGFILEQLPEFRRSVTVSELPGWTCLKRE
jgi:hypothetical protein